MEPASFPAQVLLGVYLGLITGIVPALVAWGLGFGFKYLTGVTIPGFGVVVLALALAGVNGGLLALNDPTVKQSANQTAVIVAILVVLMLSLYAHAKGDKMGVEMPKRFTLRRLTERTLSSDVVELVGARGQVKVTISGEVGDIEGYPQLPVELRQELKAAELTFPADLPLPELEARVADRLRSDYDLADVSVRLDEKARATVNAAPPVSGLSKRVPTGKRAVSISALVPTGLARGDEVRIITTPAAETASEPTPGETPGQGEAGAPEGAAPDAATEPSEPSEPAVEPKEYLGTVLSASSGKAEKKGEAVATDGGEAEAPAPPPKTPTTTGGRGRVTVAVDRPEAAELFGQTADTLLVRSRGERREFELVSLLRRAGKRFRKLTVREGGALDGRSIGEAAVRDTYGVVVLAVRTEGRWRLAPGGDVTPHAGDELFAVGTREALDAFREAIA